MAEGSEPEFRQWVAVRRERLRKTAYLLCGDWFLADDLVQEALTRLYSHWDRVTASGDPDPYVRRILVNLHVDHRRRPARREDVRSEVPESPAPTSASAGERDDVVEALRSVPPGQRAVLVLRYWDDLSIEQTARALRTSSGNVKSQASRGLRALRVALAERGIESDAVRMEESP